jgi:hypothetical protein
MRERTVEGRLQRYAEIQQAEYDAIHARAAVIMPEELADALIDLFVKLHPQAQAERFRAQALAGVRTALTVCAPDLDGNLADDVAAVVLNNMKTMVGLHHSVACVPNAVHILLSC